MTELLQQAGSFRRLMEAYWRGQLTAVQECVIENAVSEERRCAFKPGFTMNEVLVSGC